MTLTCPVVCKKNKESISIILIIIGFALFYWVGMGNHYLLQPDEARYSEIAREMLVNGNFITPYLNHMIFFDKPIMYYWLTAFAFKLFGIGEFAARFFPAVAGIICVAATYGFTRYVANQRTAIIAALVLGTAPLFWGSAHYSNMDLLVATFVTLSLYCFWIGIHPKTVQYKAIWLYASYAFSAIAILTKGLLGFVFPCMIIGLWILCCNQWRVLLKMRLISGLLLLFAIIAPWFYLVQKQNSDFFHYFFYIQQWQRYLTSSFNSQHGLWFYPTFLFLGFMPWALFMITGLQQAFKKIWGKSEQTKLLAFLLIWFFAILIFFSIPKSKLVGYILSTLPPMAILIAIHMNDLWEKYPINAKRIFIGLAVITITLEVILMSSLTSVMNQHSTKPIAEKIKPLLTPDTRLVTYYHNHYDLGFYTGVPIYIVANWSAHNLVEDNWKSRFEYAAVYHPKDPSYLLEPNDFTKLWKSSTPVIVVVKTSWLKHFPYKDYHVITHTNGYVAISNQDLSKK